MKDYRQQTIIWCETLAGPGGRQRRERMIMNEIFRNCRCL